MLPILRVHALAPLTANAPVMMGHELGGVNEGRVFACSEQDIYCGPIVVHRLSPPLVQSPANLGLTVVVLAAEGRDLLQPLREIAGVAGRHQVARIVAPTF